MTSMELFWQAVSDFLGIALPILVTIIAGFLIQQIRILETKLKNEKPNVYDEIEKYAKWGVWAAEQLGVLEIIKQGYSDKKSFAIAFIQREIEIRFPGVNVDVQLIADKVEAAVFSEINRGRAAKPVSLEAIRASERRAYEEKMAISKA